MTKNIIDIQFFPKKILTNLCEESYTNLNLIGNINISTYYTISIIQFNNKKHLWILSYEIIKKIT